MKIIEKTINQIQTKQGGILPCFFLRKTDSTNALAKTLVRDGIMKKGFALAEKQTSGRGRYDRKFLSKKGKGVYMTFVAPFPKALEAALGGLCCLAVLSAVKELYGIECQIKWPNDVIYHGKKLCGILPESVVADARYALIGVGINVNYLGFELGSLKKNAVSLRQITGQKSDVNALAIAVAEKLDCLFSQYESDYEKLLAEYRTACATIGKAVCFDDGTEVKSGIATDVDSDCALLVKCGEKTEKIAWGEISVKNLPE